MARGSEEKRGHSDYGEQLIKHITPVIRGRQLVAKWVEIWGGDLPFMSERLSSDLEEVIVEAEGRAAKAAIIEVLKVLEQYRALSPHKGGPVVDALRTCWCCGRGALQMRKVMRERFDL